MHFIFLSNDSPCVYCRHKHRKNDIRWPCSLYLILQYPKDEKDTKTAHCPLYDLLSPFYYTTRIFFFFPKNHCHYHINQHLRNNHPHAPPLSKTNINRYHNAVILSIDLMEGHSNHDNMTNPFNVIVINGMHASVRSENLVLCNLQKHSLNGKTKKSISLMNPLFLSMEIFRCNSPSLEIPQALPGFHLLTVLFFHEPLMMQFSRCAWWVYSIHRLLNCSIYLCKEWTDEFEEIQFNITLMTHE